MAHATRQAPPVTNLDRPHLLEKSADAVAKEAATAQLVRQVLSGDASALEALLVEAQQTAWRFSMTVCGHPEDAEDAMQEALVRTYRHVPQIRDADAFRPWLYRTVRNACLMSRRKRVAEPRSLLPLDELLPTPDGERKREARAQGPSPEDETARLGLGRSLDRAMRKLPPAFRAVVFLRDVEGLSTRETAHALALSEDNVKARLHRARLFLRRELVAWHPPRGRRSAGTGSTGRRRTAS